MGTRLKELSLMYKNNTLNKDDKKNIEYEAKSLLENMSFTIKILNLIERIYLMEKN
ncbi:hypothetical protein JTT01_22240 [Clostridium botulinum]|nr:hypothetical protein [Clostridium botulinum]